MLLRYSVALTAASAALPALAADLALKVEIPRLTVAEYHRPYVAMWLEKADQSFVGNLALWYAVDKRDNGGTKWLKDMRAWWRKSGRSLTLPVDGLSGATRAPGEHTLQFNGTKSPLNGLAPGEYHVVVESAREVGGRELVRVPLQWPPKSALTTQAKGTSELGAVSVSVKP